VVSRFRGIRFAERLAQGGDFTVREAVDKLGDLHSV